MSRDVRAATDLPAAPAEVLALRTSQRWVDLRAQRFADGSELIERVEDERGISTLVSRDLPAGAPSVLERFLPSDGKVVQRETWGALDASGVAEGTWSVEIAGAPASLTGTGRIESAGTGSRFSLEGTVKVSVPLIGGKAEQFVGDLVSKLMEREAQLMAEALQP